MDDTNVVPLLCTNDKCFKQKLNNVLHYLLRNVKDDNKTYCTELVNSYMEYCRVVVMEEMPISEPVTPSVSVDTACTKNTYELMKKNLKLPKKLHTDDEILQLVDVNSRCESLLIAYAKGLKLYELSLSKKNISFKSLFKNGKKHYKAVYTYSCKLIKFYLLCKEFPKLKYITGISVSRVVNRSTTYRKYIQKDKNLWT